MGYTAEAIQTELDLRFADQEEQLTDYTPMPAGSLSPEVARDITEA